MGITVAEGEADNSHPVNVEAGVRTIRQGHTKREFPFEIESISEYLRQVVLQLSSDSAIINGDEKSHPKGMFREPGFFCFAPTAFVSLFADEAFVGPLAVAVAHEYPYREDCPDRGLKSST